MAGDTCIQLAVGGRIYYFPGAKVWRSLKKNTTIFKLVKGNKGRDLLRVEDTFRFTGDWYNDGNADYDSISAFQRYCNFMLQHKYGTSTSNVGPLCTLVWGTRRYMTRLKTSEFNKASGHGDRMSYDITLLKVTK